MNFYRVVNSTYARYKRATGTSAKFAIPVYGRANFGVRDMFVQGLQGAGDAFGNANIGKGLQGAGNAFGGANLGQGAGQYGQALGQMFDGARQGLSNAAQIPGQIVGRATEAAQNGARWSQDAAKGMGQAIIPDGPVMGPYINNVPTGDFFAQSDSVMNEAQNAFGGIKDMLTNGQIDPAELAAAAAAGLGATAAGVMAWRKRMKGAAPAVEGVRQTMGLGKKLAIGGGLAAAGGGLAYGANRMGQDEI